MSTSRTRRRVPFPTIALTIALAASATGCGEEEPTAAAAGEGAAAGGAAGTGKAGVERPDETAVPVEVTTIARGRIEQILRFSTNLIAERQVRVHAQAAQLVRELEVEEGDDVARGAILLRLQDDELRSSLDKAWAEYERTLREHERIERLWTQGLVSEQAYSDSTFNYEQLKLALEDAYRAISYTEVRAPIGGTITRRLVGVGDRVAIGQHLFDLVDFSSLVAPIYVPEKELGRLELGQPARVRPQAATGDGNPGRIERIAPIVDPKSGTVKVTVAIAERAGLRPGMYVDVTLFTDVHPDALLLPKRSLVFDADQVFVYRLKKDQPRRVERVAVEVVLGDKDNVEPAAGFAEGDRIVVAGQAGLKDGALVRLPGDPEPTDAADDDDDGAA